MVSIRQNKQQKTQKMNRIKTLAIALGAMLTVCIAQAQSIVKQDATMEEFFQLINRSDVTQQAEVEGQGDNIQRLNHAGFKLFAFDISPMEMDKYGFRPAIMKYENGKIIAVTPKIRNILAILEPMTLPMAMSPLLLKALDIETNNSGALVPMPTIVRPMMKLDILARWAMATDESTR